MNFHETFNYLLQERGITAYQVWKRTGIPQSSISKWKTGEKEPSIGNLQKLSELFEVSTDYLLGLCPFKNLDQEAERYKLENPGQWEMQLQFLDDNFGPDFNILSVKLADLIRVSKINLDQIEKQTGISSEKISALMNNLPIDIAPIEISALAETLGVSYAYLSGLDIKEKPTTVSDDGLVVNLEQRPKLRELLSILSNASDDSLDALIHLAKMIDKDK